VRAGFTLFGFEMWRVSLEVGFITPNKVVMVFNIVWAISFDTVRSLGLIYKDSVSLLPTVLVLEDTRVHICSTNSCNVASYVEALVD